MGIKVIETYAMGRPGDVGADGWYVWARAGFNAELTSDEVKLLPIELAQAQTVNDLMASEIGRDWWRKHGSGRDMKFELSPGSTQWRILTEYMREIGETT